jgi:hypothetical protein
MGNAYTRNVLVVNVKGSHRFEDLGIAGIILLKWNKI